MTPPNVDSEALIQVGWWIPDEFTPEGMSKRIWEGERLLTLWTVEDGGGLAPEWKGRAVPVYIKAPSPSAPKTTVHFKGGPWNGQTCEVERVIGPVFAVGHKIGNYYWFNVKSDPPTYFWEES